MSSAVKILPHYTYEEYCKWEGRWELIEGIPYAMSPAPAPRHQWICNNFKFEAKTGIIKEGCKDCKVYDFIDIKIAEDTVLQPDAVICCKAIVKPYLDFPPSLVMEVLSPSTAMKDRNNKFYQYQSFKVPYYVIIDPDNDNVEIYSLDTTGKYQSLEITPGQKPLLFLDAGCSIQIKLDGIWQ